MSNKSEKSRMTTKRSREIRAHLIIIINENKITNTGEPNTKEYMSNLHLFLVFVFILVRSYFPYYFYISFLIKIAINIAVEWSLAIALCRTQ